MVDQVFSRTNPADGSELPAVSVTSADEVAAIVKAARKAQAAWASRSFDERAAAVLALGRRLLERRAEVLTIMAGEMGRSETECLMNEVAATLEFIKQAIRAGRKALAPEKIKLSGLDYPGKKIVVEMVPRGVVAIIAPWNYPLGNFFKSLFPALLAGDAVVLKPSEHTPRTGAWLAKIAGEVLPEGLVGLVQGAGQTAEQLLDAEIDAVVFTGSVPTGKKVSAKAAAKLVPCSLELGGKDAAIVLADCDLERTVAGIAQWGFHNCGQNCAAIERVYVEGAIADRFVERLAEFARALRVAPQKGVSDLAPLQNDAQLAVVERHVAEAVERGAKLVAGGERTGKGRAIYPPCWTAARRTWP